MNRIPAGLHFDNQMDLPTDKSKNEMQERLQNQRVTLHQEWLNDITTQTLIAILRCRIEKFKSELLNHVLEDTDQRLQDRHRASIKTLEAEIQIISNSEKFVELAKQLNPTLVTTPPNQESK